MIDKKALEAEVGRLLKILYHKRLAALDKLSLKRLLDKNPYLYRALGFNDSLELLRQVLNAFVSSSDETIFGNAFFEPLALWSANASNEHSGGERVVTISDGAGVDISIRNKTTHMAIAVKSSKGIFNSQSEKGQNLEFNQMQARAKKSGLEFMAVVGFGYGRKGEPKKSKVILKLAGEKFWTLLTAEDDFYLRIERAIGIYSLGHGDSYRKAFDKKCNSLVKEFSVNFVDDDGSIEWDKIVKFNSSIAKPKALKKS
jgi:Type II restriction endonuclease EcoO109I